MSSRKQTEGDGAKTPDHKRPAGSFVKDPKTGRINENLECPAMKKRAELKTAGKKAEPTNQVEASK